MKCPICKSNETINLLNLNCGNLDNSTLYQYVKINACNECGHIYNYLNPEEINGLNNYYNVEYGPLNIKSPDKVGDRPGSNNPFTIKRHEQLFYLISSNISKISKILDVGCAMGGFLDYLNKKGFNHLYGIDIIEDYVNFAKKKGSYEIKLGSAEAIPFEDNTFDLLVLDQVLEHLVEPRKAIIEAKRVLAEGGLFCIGIPDASRYDEMFFFDFYWFIMREHIQHYDLEHIRCLAEMEGFEFVSSSKTNTPMINNVMILPNLSIVFRLTDKKSLVGIEDNKYKLRKETERYIENEFQKLEKKRVVLRKLAETQKPLYIWGIGREFLYLYEAAGLKNCNIIGLIDANPYKQEHFTVGGIKISKKSILKEASSDSVLIISAIAYKKEIKNTLNQIGFSGEIIEV